MTARLLIVDSDRRLRREIRSELEVLFQVVEAHNGESAWAAFLEHEPDLVITELVISGFDGLELVERIKDHATLSNTPVIILTGATRGEELPANFWLKGTRADAFLEKPFEAGSLRQEIDRLLKAKLNYRPLPPGKGYYD